MARKRIKGFDLEKEISRILTRYGEGVSESVAPAVEDVAKDTVQQLRTTGDYEDRTGNYRKSFNYDMSKTYRGATGIVYSKSPEYRLTHLLERGHLTRDGTTRTKAYPHWKPAEEKAIKDFRERITEDVEKVRV